MRSIDADALKADFMRISRCADTVEELACAMEHSIDNAPTIDTNEKCARLLSECMSKGYLTPVDIMKVMLGI